MNKSIPNLRLGKLIVVILLISCSFISCQKSPINGDLDGQWQIMSVEPQPDVDDTLISNQRYFCFYLHVCQLSVPGGIWLSGNMDYYDDKLQIFFPRTLNTNETDVLKLYGINSNPVNFIVEKIDGKSLILRDGGTVVTMRKF